MNAYRQSLEVRLRRHIENGDDEGAQQIALELANLIGEPRESDRHPTPIECWGTDA